MGKVTVVTFSYTFLQAIFFLLSRGWSTTTDMVDREQATNLTFVLGTTYILYSAYFLSTDIEGMVGIVNFVLSTVYVVLGY